MTKPARLQSVDALRGLVMIVMALDHVRDFFHADAMFSSPEDLSKASAILFFTRWITHFCAPVFMFSAGIGAYLWLQRSGRSKGELSSYLWKRGLWLIVLELVALRFAMTFSLTQGLVMLTVFWALGWSMIVLAGLIHLSARVLAPLSVAVIVLHNSADKLMLKPSWLWNLLHQPGVFMAGGVPVLAAYPLIPWFAVMAAGYCFGPVFTFDPARRRSLLLRLGFTLTLAFFVLRGLNVYADPTPWTSANWISFFRVTKYPPSLDFLLMTLGPAMLSLAWLGERSFRPTNPLIVFGRVPLFYFLGHFLLAHLLAFPLAWARYGEASFVFHVLPSLGGDAKLYPPGYGYSLPGVYVIWLTVVLLMYPLCLWFDRLKQRRQDWWLSYL